MKWLGISLFRNISILLVFFALLLNSSLFAQSYPGGVTNTELWFKYNHVQGGFQDYSGNNIDVRNEEEYEQGVFNFNPSFLGNDLIFQNIFPLEKSVSRHKFIVADVDDNDKDYALATNRFIELPSSYIIERPLNDTSSVNTYVIHTKDAYAGYLNADMSVNENAAIYAYSWDQYLQSFKYKQYGKQGESLNLIGQMTPNDLIDRPDAGFSGFIPEFIYYDRDLTKNEFNRVVSYLALKYGITLDSGIDYLDSKNNTFWGSNNNDFFPNRIFGIGKDKLSDLYQSESESRHNQDYIVFGLDDIQERNDYRIVDSYFKDREFIVMGDTGGQGWSKFQQTNKKHKRTWLVELTGSDFNEKKYHIRINLDLLIGKNSKEYELLKEKELSLRMILDTYVDNLSISDFTHPKVNYIPPTAIYEDNNGVLYADFKEGLHFTEAHSIYNQFTFILVDDVVVSFKPIYNCEEAAEVQIDCYDTAIVIEEGMVEEVIVINEETGEEIEINWEESERLTAIYGKPTYVFYGCIGNYKIIIKTRNGREYGYDYEVEPKGPYSVELGPDVQYLDSNGELLLDASIAADPDAFYKWYFNDMDLNYYEPILNATQIGNYEVHIKTSDGVCEYKYGVRVVSGLEVEIICNNDGESSNNKTNTNINSGVNNSNGRSYDVSQWIDLNGDGLPDQVRITESGIFVSLNTGYGFLPETQWNTSISLNSTSTRVNFGMGMGGSFAPFPDTVDPDTGIVTINPSFGFGLGASISKARRNVQFSDVNGDGLPDLIYSELTSNQLKYYYQPNTGSGFHSTALLLFTDHIEEDQTLAANIYGTATAGFIIPIPFVTIKLTGTPTAGVNAALSEKTIRFQDIDGDGLPDVLSQKGSGTSIRVHRNRTGKTGLLKKVNTPLGGSWTIDYNREGNTYEMASSKWVLSKVRTHDGFTQDDNFDDANSETLTTFKYENGRYDRRDREFFGFEKVTTEERNPQSGSRYRYVVQEFLNTNYYTQGALKKQTTYDDDDNVLTQQKHYYNLIIPNQTHVANLNTDLNNPFQMFGLGELDRTRASLLLVKTTSTEYEDNQDQGRTLSQHFLKFDKYGNILSYENIGNSGSDAYLANITYDYGNAIFKRLPKNIEVRARRTNELLRKRKATYSNKGGLTSVTVFQEANKTSTILYGYDSFGNIISLTKQDLLGENGGSYNMKINYDNELQTYPVNINDSYSESSSTIYDYLFGVPVEITDKTGNKMRTRIDNRGRVIEITAPNEYGGSNSTGWTIRMEYQGEDIVANQLQSNNAQNTEYRFHTAQGEFKAIRPGSATPTDKQHYAVTRHNVLGAYQQELLTISIVDGLGKPIQLKKTHYSNGSLKWQVSGKEHTDVYGRAIYSYLPTIQQPYPTNINQLSNTDLEYDNQFSSLSPLATEYDVKDRPVWIQQPYEVDATDIFYSIQNNLAVTEVINELGQTQETHTDIRGRQVKTIQNNEITTSFYYNLVGELIRVHNNAGMDTKYYYNLGGLRIREEQPDRGVTNYTYDEAGRLTHKKTSNLDGQQEIEYQYNYDRLTAINYPLNPSQNVQYTYGSFGNDTGRIIEQRDAIGIQRFKYGKLGELIEQINAMAVAGKTSYWFKTQWEYDSWNRIKKIVYPDSEEVTYRYNQAGQLDSVTSAIPGVQAHNVVNGIEYNDYGERKSITYGNGTTTNYTYDNRRRLEQLDFDFTGFQQTREYRYDALSNILGIETISSTPPSTGVLGGPVHHTYKYDNYNRLVMAEGSYVGPDDYQPFMLKQEYSLQMSYDPSHSILSKTQNHKYGSVASVTDPLRNDALFAPTAYHLEYEDYNRGQYSTDGYAYTQPHAPRTIVQYPVDNPNDPTDPRVETQFLDYDANGNITHIERATNNPEQPMDESRESVRKFVWDEEDRLMGVDLRPESPRNQPHIAAYTYDAGGERGIRYVPRQMGGVYSATQAGYAQDMDIMLYPNALITVRPQELPEDFGPKHMHPEHTFTTYTKHYYIGSERINSKLGTVNNLGVLCEEMEPNSELINEMNERAHGANKWLEKLYHYLDKELEVDAPYLYSTNHAFVCDYYKGHNGKLYDSYWYHPDHLGSSSFITNTTGEISQHMEYLPFGETLVEEHLNSHNSPFKFNAKEYDAETGNYYYGARYYDPKWSMWLSVDPLAEKNNFESPYVFVHNNPLVYVDPDGRDGIRIIDRKNKSIIIHAVYYVQTEARPTSRKGKLKGYTSKQISKMETNINNWYNKQNLSVSEGEFQGYSIQFDLRFEEGGYTHDTRIKASAEKYEGFDIGNSFDKGNSKTNPIVFTTEYNENGTTNEVGGVTDVKKFITMNTKHDYLANKVHEIGHTLGLDDNKNTGAKGGLMEYPPGKISQKEANQLGNSDFLPAVSKKIE